MTTSRWTPYASRLSGTEPVLWVVLAWTLFPRDADWSWLLPITLLAVAAFLLFRQLAFARRLKRARQALPWFAPVAVQSHALDDEPELAAKLAAAGFGTVEIDGRTIANRDELANALAQALGGKDFARDPLARCRAILMRAAMARDGHRVLVWRHAAASAPGDPAMLVEFAADWSTWAQELPRRLLIVLDLPPPPAPAPAPRSDTAPRYVLGDRAASDPSDLAAAPREAWWKPRPGELAD